MKKKYKISLIIIVVMIVIIAFISRYPIYITSNTAAENVTHSDVSLNDKVSINDALEAILKAAGANEDVFYFYGSMDYYSIPFIPKYTELDELDIPFTAWHIGNLLVDHNIFNDDDCYYANKPATVKNVAVMMQACLEDTEEIIMTGGMEYYKLYCNAKNNGIIKKCDTIYYTGIDADITYAQLYVLLDRFKDQKRYKYFDCNKSDLDSFGYVVYDKERMLTYRAVSGEYMSEAYKKLRNIKADNIDEFNNVIDVVLADKSGRTEYDLRDVEQMVAENPDGYMALYKNDFIRLRDELGFEYIRKNEDGIRFYPLRDKEHSASLGLFSYKGEAGRNEWEFFELDK